MKKTPRATRISATISRETQRLLERQAKATGVQKRDLIESALRYHLRALQGLPAEALVPAQIVFTNRSFDHVLKRLRSPGQPATALRKLMRRDPG